MWSYQHTGFTVHQIEALSDNYIYIIDFAQTSILAVVDPAEGAPVAKACEQLGRTPTHILNTHHHWDHTGANLELKERYGCTVIGAATDKARIPGIDEMVSEANPLNLNGMEIRILDVPGHTRGHIAFVLDNALFCGDVLFGAGCGRIFEGTEKQMWNSLNKVFQLDENTMFYCAHEYTLTNLEFALHADPDNASLTTRMAHTRIMREANTPTIPGTLSEEMATNPFLRPLDKSFRQSYADRHQIQDDALTVFTHIRNAKNNW